MPRITIAPAVLREHLPRTGAFIVGPEHIDIMGHMNVGHYSMAFADAAREMTSLIGVTKDYIAQKRMGAFMLRNFAQFISEVHNGEAVSIYTRVIARSEKRYQYMHFLLNDTRDNLAATMEALTSHADLTRRRSAPFPSEMLVTIDEYITAHNQVDWEGATLSGLLGP